MRQVLAAREVSKTCISSMNSIQTGTNGGKKYYGSDVTLICISLKYYSLCATGLFTLSSLEAILAAVATGIDIISMQQVSPPQIPSLYVLETLAGPGRRSS